MKYVFDIDGTLCTQEENYADAKPLPKRIAKVNRLHKQGDHICLFTARGTETGIDWRKITEKQLADWGLEYDELMFGKPAADVYVDDKGINAGCVDW